MTSSHASTEGFRHHGQTTRSYHEQTWVLALSQRWGAVGSVSIVPRMTTVRADRNNKRGLWVGKPIGGVAVGVLRGRANALCPVDPLGCGGGTAESRLAQRRRPWSRIDIPAASIEATYRRHARLSSVASAAWLASGRCKPCRGQHIATASTNCVLAWHCTLTRGLGRLSNS